MELRTRTIRLAVVIPRYAPIFGGAENQCRSLNKSLLATGSVEIPFLLTCRLESGLARNDLIDGVQVRRLGFPGLGRIGSYSFYLSTFLCLLTGARDYDIVHCHTADSICGFVVTLAGKITRRPVLLKLSTNGDFGRAFGDRKRRGMIVGSALKRFRKFRMGFISRNAQIIALNEEGREELIHAGVVSPIVVPNGVDRAAYSPVSELSRQQLRRQHGFRESDIVFLFTGRFVWRKGIDLLLTAFQSFLAKNVSNRSQFKLCLVGSGHLQADTIESQIVNIANQYSDHIEVRPPINPVTEYLQMADIFVLPSRWEGMPNSVLEALAAGLPCILSDIEPHRELGADIRAPLFYFGSGDSRALESQLELAAAHVESARSRGDMRTTYLSDSFDIATVSRLYLDVYRQCFHT